MINPFKKSYRITEFENQNGETKFTAEYSSPFLRTLELVDSFGVYINADGDIVYPIHWGEHYSFERAQQAIERHKTKATNELKAKYKKSTIHYVE